MRQSIQDSFTKSVKLADLQLWVAACTEDDRCFLEFWAIAKNPQQKYAWRALWLIEHAIKKKETLLDLILDELYILLVQTNSHSILRMGLKLVILRPLTSTDIVGQLLNKCEEILLDTKMPIATRANSLQFIFEFCKTEPDFINELEVLLDHIAEQETSAGMKSRVRLIRKALIKL